MSDQPDKIHDLVREILNRLTAAEDRTSKHDNEIASYRGEIDDLRTRVEELEGRIRRGEQGVEDQLNPYANP